MPPTSTPGPSVGGEETSGRERPPGWMGWSLPIGFLALAGVLFAGSRLGEVPAPPAADVDRDSLFVRPRRTAMMDPPHINVDGVPQRCNGCHQIFQSNSPAGAALHYHQDLELRHGMNNRCVNCHDATDRERLTLRDGATVPFAETPQLCAQCHGTVYRDWQRGTHGKTLGSWVTDSPAQRRLSCNECHNPHTPRYEPYTPLPGPNTLRMGHPGPPASAHPSGKDSPLQRWLREAHASQLDAQTNGSRP